MAETHKYRGTKQYLPVYSELIAAARYRGTVTYQEVAAIMDLPLQGQHMGREVGLILGEISREELTHNRPMLSAIVVTVGGTPGPGFFNLAREQGRLTGESGQAEQQFWHQEKEAIYATWRKELKPK